MLLALLGYAIGTLQILVLDWFRERSLHTRQLRAIRAELRRAASFKATFNWTAQGPAPGNDYLPRPPNVSPRFVDLVTQTHFYLTDEHHDDNSQEALLAIEDGCASLRHYFERIQEWFDKVRTGVDVNTSTRLKSDMVLMAAAYDRDHARLLFTIEDAIKDLNRRLDEAHVWRQLNRPVGRLPAGANPPPLVANDPRLVKREGAA